MARPKDDEAESQRKKYEHHKKANNTLKHYLEEGRDTQRLRNDFRYAVMGSASAK